MKTYVDEYFKNLNGPAKRSFSQDYGVDFTKMNGNIMVATSCAGKLVDAGLMSCRNFLLSLQTRTLIFNPCRVVSVLGGLRVWRNCDGGALVFEYLLPVMPEYMYLFSQEPIEISSDQLVPAVVFDTNRGQVLMVAAVNREALDLTRQTSLATFYSRSRQKVWVKGEASGNTIRVCGVQYNPRGDGAILYEVAKPPDEICHTGKATCFSYDDLLTKLLG